MWRLPVEAFIPEAPHLGAFGAVRKHHTHEGVDLYCPEGTEVRAVEAGRVVKILPFTGPKADSPWWHDTYCVMAEGKTGVVLYGELVPVLGLRVGARVEAGRLLGHVTQVLRKDKGRPMVMLHLELYDHIREPVEWPVGAPKPDGLQDPTPFLCHAGL